MGALILTSPAFSEGGAIPAKHTGFGADLSPELRLEGLTPEAVSLAVLMDDLDIPFCPAYSHWLVWNLPPAETIPEGVPFGAELPALGDAVQGVGYGKHRYRGPLPPFFEPRRHRYRFTVLALDARLELPPESRRRDLMRAAEGHILQQAQLTGYFRRGAASKNREGAMMSTAAELAKAYLDGLKKTYYDLGPQGQEMWDHFASIAHGASREDLDRLLEVYPDAPESLLELLKLVDGTYWREYQGEKVAFRFLGSDYEGYPYYLLSAQQIVETKDRFAQWGDYIINREEDDVPVDEGVCDDMDRLNLLHFSDCINNGGTSQLFLDFSPSAKGKKGQVLRYLHDPDEMVVAADSFDEYLQMLMDQGYAFIDEDILDE